jgi:protein-S-isoprenylcysteine O-methyltransferase Ste14
LAQLAFAWFSAGAFAASLLYFLYEYLVRFDAEPAAPAVSILVNLFLFTSFALHHSVFARTRVKALVTALIPHAIERAVYTLVASLLFTLVIWFWQPLPGHAWSLNAPWSWAGYAVQAAGIVLTVIAARTLDVWELAGVRQVSAWRRDPVVLQTHGLYGFVRHPLYFSWVLLVFGAPEMTMTRLSFALISTAYLAIAIPFEERSLIETFGTDYASYQKQVPWKMMPGLY